MHEKDTEVVYALSQPYTTFIMLSSHMQEKHSVHHLKSLQFHRDVNILMLSSMGCLFIINYFKYMYLQK